MQLLPRRGTGPFRTLQPVDPVVWHERVFYDDRITIGALHAHDMPLVVEAVIRLRKKQHSPFGGRVLLRGNACPDRDPIAAPQSAQKAPLATELVSPGTS